MKTVKVKIAVAVDKNGKWSSSGWGDTKTDLNSVKYFSDAMGFAVEMLEGGENRFWLTAELPIPEEVEINPNVAVAV